MKKILSIILSLVTVLSLSVPAFAATTDFSDVPSSHWAYSSIKWCADNDIVKGIGNNKFAPNDTLTGAQFSVMIARTFYSDAVAAEKKDSDNWYSAEMRVLENKGVYAFKNAATGNNLVLIEDANTGLSRYRMAIMMSNIIGNTVTLNTQTLNSVGAQLTDIMSDYLYAGSVAHCVVAGVLKGYDDGKFHGEDTLTRAQATAVIYRLYNLMNGNEQAAETEPETEKKNETASTGTITTSTGIALPENYTELRYSEMTEEQAWEAIRVELTKLIRDYQTANGLKSCEEWDVLVTGATARSKELVQKFAHGRPDGRSTATLYEELYGTDVVPSENCWKGTTYDMTIADTATAIFNSWKNSPGHNETMLDGFDYIGVGIYRQGGMTYAVTHFVIDIQYNEICSERPDMAAK